MSGLGAFEDRKGTRKRQKVSRIAGVEGDGEDEVEEKLETLVFGKQLLFYPERKEEEQSSSKEEEEVRKGNTLP